MVRGGQPDVSNWHECETEGGAKPVRLCPCSSDVNLLSYGEGIIDFNTEIPDSALDLRMSQQQLHGTLVAGSTVDQRRFGASKGVRAEETRVEANRCNQLETSRADCRVVMQRL